MHTPDPIRPVRKRLMLSALTILAAVYLALVLVGLFLSEAMMFQPRPSSYRDTPEILKIPSADGSTLSARLLENNKARYTILFSHGNAEDLGNIAGHLEQFRQHGFSAMAYDYSGYGTSSGKPTERAALLNVEAAYDYLVSQRGISPDRIIVWGRSIGSGPAVHLATFRPVAGLVIESGFTSAFRVMTRVRLLPFDRFDNLRGLERVACPVLVIHGTDDGIIPFRHGQRLFDTAREPKFHLWVERAGHNNLVGVAGPAYWEAAGRFEKLLTGRSSGEYSAARGMR
jgi:fermentation-respiration switch protein FrsA (DUF1100 family)